MSDLLPCITIRPPWTFPIAEAAALEALGAVPKLTENRGRRIAEKWIGQRVGIHAGQTWDKAAVLDGRVWQAWKAFRAGIGVHEPTPALAAIGDQRTGLVGGLRRDSLWVAVGAVVAAAELVDCHERAEHGCCAPWGDDWYVTKAGVVRAWHLVLGNVRRLRKPVPAKGSLAMPWRLPAEQTAAVIAQIAEVTA